MTAEKVQELVKQCDIMEYIEADKELVIKGYMNFDEEDKVCNEFHDCDAMGCSSVGPHILFRFNWQDGIARG
jgi:hypothetical protein